MALIKLKVNFLVLQGVFSALTVTQEPFLEKDENGNFIISTNNKGQQAGKLKLETLKEAKEMISKFDGEILTVDLEPFNEKIIKKALKSSIFDGIDLTPLFDTLIK